MNSEGTPKSATEGRLILALYALELGAVMFVLALRKYSDRLSALSLRQVLVLCGPLVLVAALSVFVFSCYRTLKRTGGRVFEIAVILNVMVVVMVFGVGEVVVRALSVDTPLGLTFAGTPLMPRSWERTKLRAANLMQSAPQQSAFIVSDTLLGWTVGASRRSKDSMYLSGAEGIRSPRVGVTYASDSGKKPVAIVGDSFTFGEDGPYADSWGAKLDSLLAGERKVLNFGVPGFGVDQAHLRYMRDVRPWHPSVAIFGFINHDLIRSMSVYWLISSADWGFPMAKPRFALKNGAVELLNVPLIRPESILTTRSVADLPFVNYEPGFDPADWRWHFYYSSHLVQYLLARFPRYSLPRPEVGDDALVGINTRLFIEFTRAAAAEGTVPLVVYYPSRSDFEGLDLSAKNSVLAALIGAGVTALDLTACVREVGPERAFIPGKRHYSAAGNEAVARCLLPVVKQNLGRVSG